VEPAYISAAQIQVDRYSKVFMTTPPTLSKLRRQFILAVLMLCSLLIWLDNTVLNTTLETLADPVRRLGGLANIPTAVGALAGALIAPRLVRRVSLRLVTIPALTVAALTMGGYGFLGLRTPLVWIEILLLIQGLSVGMVIGPVTAALISKLPLEQAGAGSAVTNTVRQTGSVIGIAVGGTVMSIVYRRAIEPSLDGVPGPVRDQARVSAEQARHVARVIHRPTHARAADNAFIHAMHVGAGWIAVIALLGSAVLLVTLPAAANKVDPIPEPDYGEACSSTTRAAQESQSPILKVAGGADVGSH
jgi:MFS family permease